MPDDPDDLKPIQSDMSNVPTVESIVGGGAARARDFKEHMAKHSAALFNFWMAQAQAVHDLVRFHDIHGEGKGPNSLETHAKKMGMSYRTARLIEIIAIETDLITGEIKKLIRKQADKFKYPTRAKMLEWARGSAKLPAPNALAILRRELAELRAENKSLRAKGDAPDKAPEAATSQTGQSSANDSKAAGAGPKAIAWADRITTPGRMTAAFNVATKTLPSNMTCADVRDRLMPVWDRVPDGISRKAVVAKFKRMTSEFSKAHARGTSPNPLTMGQERPVFRTEGEWLYGPPVHDGWLILPYGAWPGAARKPSSSETKASVQRVKAKLLKDF